MLKKRTTFPRGGRQQRRRRSAEQEESTSARQEGGIPHYDCSSRTKAREAARRAFALAEAQTLLGRVARSCESFEISVAAMKIVEAQERLRLIEVTTMLERIMDDLLPMEEIQGIAAELAAI